ncbi:DHA1 family arabinose polymer transporter-like MFS transporter [Saonia flava]|uniref:DHA1 family arabinose polymer transporter-like MFS transporter n=1 Tax=Saonia flava TaxID=523696 RepID=A0A846QSY3_9FLAO|nr:MFS transporter [Saonia flava]NJB70070.1 DHA1 family arabinose polymer transporter-like MFS transporter [Saonia flava]
MILGKTNKKALIALAIGGFGIGLTEFVIMGILPDIASALRITIPQAGHFIAAYALGVVVGAPLIASIGSRFQAHKILLYLMVWFTVFNTLSAFAESYSVLLVSRFLSGLPHGAFFGIGAVVAGKLSKPGKTASAIATMFAGLTIANVIGVPIGTYLGHEFHWSISFIMVGAIGILTMLSIYLWMPTIEKEPETSFKREVRVLWQPEFIGLILLTMIGTGGFFAWYSYIAPLLTEVSGLSESMVSYAMIIAGLGMVVGNFVGAKMAERYYPLKAVVISLTLMVCVLIINTMVASNSIAILVLTFAVGVVSFSVATPIQMAVIKSAKGSAMLGSSMTQSAFNMGNALGAYLGGLPIALGYGFATAGLVGSLMASSGIIIALGILFFRRRSRVRTRLMPYHP